MKYCSKCGKELFDEAVICTGCGCPVESNNKASQNSKKKKLNNIINFFINTSPRLVCLFLNNIYLVFEF